MPPPNPNPDDNTHQLLLDSLDQAPIPRPFRKQNWKPSPRRNKNVKQILSETSRREAASVAATQNNSGASTPFQKSGGGGGESGSAGGDGTRTPVSAPAGGAIGGKPPNIAQAAQNLSTLVLEKNYSRSIAAGGGGGGGGPAVTYTNIEAAPSLHPAHRKHYCDITGLPAPYTDPKTRLRYHNREVFGVVRTLGQGVAENYLEARGAHVVLK
jgi:INO80 complex subunit C